MPPKSRPQSRTKHTPAGRVAHLVNSRRGRSTLDLRPPGFVSHAHDRRVRTNPLHAGAIFAEDCIAANEGCAKTPRRPLQGHAAILSVTRGGTHV